MTAAILLQVVECALDDYAPIRMPYDSGWIVEASDLTLQIPDGDAAEVTVSVCGVEIADVPLDATQTRALRDLIAEATDDEEGEE